MANYGKNQHLKNLFFVISVKSYGIVNLLAETPGAVFDIKNQPETLLVQESVPAAADIGSVGLTGIENIDAGFFGVNPFIEGDATDEGLFFAIGAVAEEIEDRPKSGGVGQGTEPGIFHATIPPDEDEN